MTGNDANARRRERFERFFAELYEPLLAYALRRTRREDAQDVVAEAFLVLWRRLDEVPGDVRPWLFGVARRALADRRRGERRRTALAARWAATHRSPDGDADEQGRLLAALARLPDGDRELLLLIAWEGFAPREAAAVLGLSRVALRVRLHRARRRLASEFDEASAEPRPRIADLKVERRSDADEEFRRV